MSPLIQGFWLGNDRRVIVEKAFTIHFLMKPVTELCHVFLYVIVSGDPEHVPLVMFVSASADRCIDRTHRLYRPVDSIDRQ